MLLKNKTKPNQNHIHSCVYFELIILFNLINVNLYKNENNYSNKYIHMPPLFLY